MPRSPIESMIDRACGLPPGWENYPRYAPKPKPSDAELTKALLEVLDAGKAWRRKGAKGITRLNRAVENAERLGL